MPMAASSIAWIIFQNNQLLISTTPNSLGFFSEDTVDSLKKIFVCQHKVGVLHDKDIYCAEITALNTLPQNFELLSLRKALEQFGPDWYAILSRAYAIINWDKNHQFCGHCGQATTQKPHVFERQCLQCGLVFYPRISPSIIVRIERGDEILMARGHHFVPGAYGLIAGFVEAGENIEDAIHREVREEVGIKIKNIRYFGSQQWPFPDSLMLGFIADYDSGEIEIDPKEIDVAGWYHYKQLPGLPSSRISIATKLVEDFVHKKQHGK